MVMFMVVLGKVEAVYLHSLNIFPGIHLVKVSHRHSVSSSSGEEGESS